MNNLTKSIQLITGTSITLVMFGCSSVPPNNDALVQAKNTVDLAKGSPAVRKYAPLQLDKAENTLSKAESTWSREGDDATQEVDHLAYLAERYAQIALEDAATGDVKAQIADTSGRRNQIMLSAREQEIERLRIEALASKQEAAASKQDAAELRGLIDELKGKQTERGLILTLGEILFDLDKTGLKPGGVNSISRLADYLKDHSDRSILIEGHTDSLGEDAYNMTLSQERANAVRNKLLEFGVDRRNIGTTGYGEAYPVASNDNAAGRQQNRRVEIVIANEGETPQYRTSSR